MKRSYEEVFDYAVSFLKMAKYEDDDHFENIEPAAEIQQPDEIMDQEYEHTVDEFEQYDSMDWDKLFE